MQDDFGIDTNYLLVADGNTSLHFYNKGTRVKSLQVGSRVNDVTKTIPSL